MQVLFLQNAYAVEMEEPGVGWKQGCNSFYDFRKLLIISFCQKFTSTIGRTERGASRQRMLQRNMLIRRGSGSDRVSQ